MPSRFRKLFKAPLCVLACKLTPLALLAQSPSEVRSIIGGHSEISVTLRDTDFDETERWYIEVTPPSDGAYYEFFDTPTVTRTADTPDGQAWFTTGTFPWDSSTETLRTNAYTLLSGTSYRVTLGWSDGEEFHLLPNPPKHDATIGDPEDTIENARPVFHNGWYAKASYGARARDVDMFNLQGSAQPGYQGYTIALKPATGVLLDAWVYDTKQCGTVPALSVTGETGDISIDVKKPGYSRLLKVKARRRSARGAYDLEITHNREAREVESLADADEFGDDYPVLKPLAAGGYSVSGNFHSASDKDFFWLETGAASFDSIIHVSGPRFTEVSIVSTGESRDTSAALPANRTNSGQFRNIGNVSARHFFAANQHYGFRVEGGQGSYALRLREVSEPGNTLATAGALTLGTATGWAAGNIAVGETDYVTFTIPDSDYYMIRVWGEEESLDVDMEILDSAGDEVQGARVDDGFIDDGFGYIEDKGSPGFDTQPPSWRRHATTVVGRLESGTYYLKITATSSGRYTIFGQKDQEKKGVMNACATDRSTEEIKDPLYGCQFNLNDINVEPVWSAGEFGDGVTVAVIDYGFDVGHEDFDGNFDPSRNIDLTGLGTDQIGLVYDHGMANAGVIAAAHNDIGMRGIAPQTTLLSWQWYRYPTDSNRIKLLGEHVESTAIVSHSITQYDDVPCCDSLGTAYWDALDYTLEHGWGGLGQVHIQAGGNAYHLQQHTGNITFLNHVSSVVACAVTEGHAKAWYSSHGAALWVCAPVERGSGRGILATAHYDGYQYFNGTSAAEPTISGVVSLLRGANRELTWRDVKLILAESSRKNDTELARETRRIGRGKVAVKDAEWMTWNRAGRVYGEDGEESETYTFSHRYGFGVVDAYAAYELARNWKRSPAPMVERTFSYANGIDVAAPAGSQASETVVVDMPDVEFVEWVDVEIDLEDSAREVSNSYRDLRVLLRSPSGIESLLGFPAIPCWLYTNLSEAQYDRCGAHKSPYYDTRHCDPDTATPNRGDRWQASHGIRISSAAFLGEDPNGEWTLEIIDEVDGGDANSITEWRLSIYGHRWTLPKPAIQPPVADYRHFAVSWDDIPNATGFGGIDHIEIDYALASADAGDPNSWTRVTADQSERAGKRIEGVEPRTEYMVRIRGVNFRNGEWSDIVKVTTLAVPRIDDKDIGIGFGASRYDLTEGESTAIRVFLTDELAHGVDVPLVLTLLGGATRDDYSGVPAVASFGEGETSFEFMFVATDDDVDDDGEAVRLSFGPLPSDVATSGITIVAIQDDDEDVDPDGGEDDPDDGDPDDGDPDDGDPDDDDDEDPAPEAAFEVSVGCAGDLCVVETGQTVVFTDTSSGSVVRREWDLGDGSTSTVPEAEHAWTEPGFYTVTLTVTDGEREASTSLTFQVEAGEPAGVCESGPRTLCLQDSRFAVEVDWWTHDGNSGSGSLAYAGTNDSGLFWFFSLTNWELLVKVLDGCAVNGHVWLYAAASTDVGYVITVADTVSGATRQYVSEPGAASEAITDSTAFPLACSGGGTSAAASSTTAVAAATGPVPEDSGPGDGHTSSPWQTGSKAANEQPDAGSGCVGGPSTLCLQNGRFEVTLEWSTADGAAGTGLVPRPATTDSGLFYFFDPGNWETLVKVLDGCAFNGHHWVLAASATDLGLEFTVRDTATETIRKYVKNPGKPASALVDVAAFPESCQP